MNVHDMMHDQRMGVLHTYADFLPLTKETPNISLGEGGTPLIRAENISAKLGVDVYLKYEGLNPTGSFKDRGMVMAVAKAVEEGSSTLMCASTGNTSASAAAYAAQANLNCIVLVPDQNIALGKMAQALMYGAKVIAIKGNFDQALRIVRRITETQPITLVNSTNPYRIEGQKTAAFEVCDQLGEAPDVLAIPVGNAGNITAYWKGFKEYHERGRVERLPAMHGFEAEGAAAIVKGEPIVEPETLASAIRIGHPASWDYAKQAADESKGRIDFVTDEQIVRAYRMLAVEEGIFAEPASAASLAGVMKMKEEHQFKGHEKVVCVLTGNGLKDPDNALQAVDVKPIVVEGREEKVLEAIEQLDKEQKTGED